MNTNTAQQQHYRAAHERPLKPKTASFAPIILPPIIEPTFAAGPDGVYLNCLGVEPAWLAEFYFFATRQVGRAIDILFSEIDALLSAGRFVECNAVLKVLDVQPMSEDLMVAVLTITSAAAERLPQRAKLVAEIETRLREMIGAIAMDEALAGLR